MSEHNPNSPRSNSPRLQIVGGKGRRSNRAFTDRREHEVVKLVRECMAIDHDEKPDITNMAARYQMKAARVLSIVVHEQGRQIADHEARIERVERLLQGRDGFGTPVAMRRDAGRETRRTTKGEAA